MQVAMERRTEPAGKGREPSGGKTAGRGVAAPGFPITYAVPQRQEEPLRTAGCAFGFDFSNVEIKEESPLADRLGAPAAAQGLTIHYARGGGERAALLHELCHIAQNAEGRVRPDTQEAGYPLCTDEALEREAQVAEHLPPAPEDAAPPAREPVPADGQVVQRALFVRTIRNVRGQEELAYSSSQLAQEVSFSGKKTKQPEKAPAPQQRVQITDEMLPGLLEKYGEWCARHGYIPAEPEAFVHILQNTMAKRFAVESREVLADEGLQQARVKGYLEADYEFSCLVELFTYVQMKGAQNAAQRYAEGTQAYRLQLINVGSGQSILIQTGGRYILLDLGPDIEILLDFLARKRDVFGGGRGLFIGGSGRIVILGTHMHDDHIVDSTGKIMATLVHSMPPSECKDISGIIGHRALMRADKSVRQALVRFLKARQLYLFDVHFFGDSKDENDNSLVMLLQTPLEYGILAGDAKQRLVRKKIRIQLGLAPTGGVKFPQKQNLFYTGLHHGSQENQGPEFYEELQRMVVPGGQMSVLVSSGTEYQHPTAAGYYEQTGKKSARVFQNGTLLHDKNYKHAMHIHYTRNMRGSAGSVVHKSDGAQLETTFTKSYRAIDAPPQAKEALAPRAVEQGPLPPQAGSARERPVIDYGVSDPLWFNKYEFEPCDLEQIYAWLGTISEEKAPLVPQNFFRVKEADEIVEAAVLWCKYKPSPFLLTANEVSVLFRLLPYLEEADKRLLGKRLLETNWQQASEAASGSGMFVQMELLRLAISLFPFDVPENEAWIHTLFPRLGEEVFGFVLFIGDTGEQYPQYAGMVEPTFTQALGENIEQLCLLVRPRRLFTVLDLLAPYAVTVLEGMDAEYILKCYLLHKTPYFGETLTIEEGMIKILLEGSFYPLLPFYGAFDDFIIEELTALIVEMFEEERAQIGPDLMIYVDGIPSFLLQSGVPIRVHEALSQFVVRQICLYLQSWRKNRTRITPMIQWVASGIPKDSLDQRQLEDLCQQVLIIIDQIIMDQSTEEDPEELMELVESLRYNTRQGLE